MPIKASDLGGRITPDYARSIILVQHAAEVPIYAALSAKGPPRITVNEKYNWTGDKHAARDGSINNAGEAYTSGTTALVVHNPGRFYPGCLILCAATGEVMYCQAVNLGTSTLTVVRGLGSVVAAHANSVANNAALLNLGSAAGEGTGSPPDRFTTKDGYENYIQTFKQTVELTDRAMANQTMTEDTRLYERKKKMEEVTRDIEHALIFGAADGDTVDADGKRATTTGGFLQGITTNVTNVGGAVTRIALETWAVEKALAFGSSDKLFVAGTTLYQACHTLFHNTLRTGPGDTVVGMDITELRVPGGVLRLVNHRGLKGAYAGLGIVIDLDAAEIRALGGEGDLRLRENIAPNDTENAKDMWKAMIGLQYGAEQSHAVIKGVTGAA